MRLIAGVDIGNATTECALCEIKENKKVIISSGIAPTTGIKGTKENIKGIFASLKKALDKINKDMNELVLIRINQASPVIGDVAMETISETIITESTMIGHNPSTPGGIGIGVGTSVPLHEINKEHIGKDIIALASDEYDFEKIAETLNNLIEIGININGAIIQKDDGVLVANRLIKNLPIIDEVNHFQKIPKNMLTAIEVADKGKSIEVLSNPYGIATLFNLTSSETKKIITISKALIGNRSAVVIKTPEGDVKEKIIPAGKINIVGEVNRKSISIEEGADNIMKTLESCLPVNNIYGEFGTNVGGMLEKVRIVMSQLTGQPSTDISIQDLLAVDTFVPQKIIGGIAEEFSLENAVGLAAMVKADKLQMQIIAEELKKILNVEVIIAGVEAEMAIIGALTTPGTEKPLAIIDMGAGSTDASIIDINGDINLCHLAGAGNMVNMLIDKELGLNDLNLAEDIKKYRLAKVESLFHIRHEDGNVEFFKEMLDPKLFARIVLLKEKELIPIMLNLSLEKIKSVRISSKEKVFVRNVIRALERIAPANNIRNINHVVLVGGSALDFEVSEMITDVLSNYGIVSGKGNIRAIEGPRNAVATGLVLSYEGG